MWLLILGWVLFLGAHLTPGVFGQRDRLVKALGEGRFTGLYIATSVLNRPNAFSKFLDILKTLWLLLTAIVTIVLPQSQNLVAKA